MVLLILRFSAKLDFIFIISSFCNFFENKNLKIKTFQNFLRNLNLSYEDLKLFTLINFSDFEATHFLKKIFQNYN